MISKELINKVNKSEEEFTTLFSKRYPSNIVERYFDDELKDMYDHNFSLTKEEINDEILNTLLRIKEERKETFIKIESPKKLNSLVGKGFEEEQEITLVKEDYKNFNIPSIDFVTYKRYSENKEIIKDVIRIEQEYYGESYGVDFCGRRWIRYANRVDQNDTSGLDIWVIYDKDIAIGYCYSFFNNEVVAMDGLLVIKEYRNRYVASNLIKHIAAYYDCPIYLHADEDDTPKEIYYKLGFIKCNVTFEYFIEKGLYEF